MAQQRRKNDLSFSAGVADGLTSTTVVQNFFTRYEKSGDRYLAEHFSYEISMLRFTDSKIDRLIPERDRCEQEGSESKRREYNTEINMALETFLVHWRGLIEFFYYPGEKRKKKRYPDDKRAYDFVERDKWEKVRGEMPKRFCEWYKRTGKEIAHLTSSRKYGTLPQKGWPYKEMRAELERIIKIFLEEANLQIKANEN